MQSLWSKVAQVRCTCNCSLCRSNTNALARRPTTAPASRNVRQDIFTLFSSTLALTATIVDSARKDVRSRQWKKVIGDAREQLEAVKIEQKRRLASLSDSTREIAFEESEVLQQTPINKDVGVALYSNEAIVIRGKHGLPSSIHLTKKLGADESRELADVESDRSSDDVKRLDDLQRAEESENFAELEQMLDSDTNGYEQANQSIEVDDGTSGTAKHNFRERWADVFEWEARQDNLRAVLGFQGWKGPPLSLLQRLSTSQLEQLLGDDRILRRFYGGTDCENLRPDPIRLTLSHKKDKTMEWSIAKLVSRLLLYCSKGSGAKTKEFRTVSNAVLQTLSSKAKTMNALVEEANKRMEMVWVHDQKSNFWETFESPHLPNYQLYSEHQYDELTILNTSIHSLLQEMQESQDLGSLMAEICRNLLHTHTAPNTHTFNLLLVRFCQLEQTHLVHAVLDSMAEIHIRPNETTHCIVLRFYTATKDRFGYASYLANMYGKAGQRATNRNGTQRPSLVSLANNDQEISPISIDRYHFFGIGLQRIAEKARMNPEVYAAVIIGAFQFFGEKLAMRLYRMMISEGWKPNDEILNAILKDCCIRMDWKSGIFAWHLASAVYQTLNIRSYQWILCLCQRCVRPAAFQEFLEHGVRQGFLYSTVLDVPLQLRKESVNTLLRAAKRLLKEKARFHVPRELRVKLRYLLPDWGLEKIIASTTDDEPQEKLKQLSELAAQGEDALRAAEFLTGRVEVVADNILATTEEVQHVINFTSGRIAKYKVSVRVQSLNREEWNPGAVKIDSTFRYALQRKSWEKYEELLTTSGPSTQDFFRPFPPMLAVPDAPASEEVEGRNHEDSERTPPPSKSSIPAPFR